MNKDFKQLAGLILLVVLGIVFFICSLYLQFAL